MSKAWVIADGEPVLTRGELVAQLQARGAANISTSLFRYWEYTGKFPAAVRRRHNGATRAIYPERAVDVAFGIRARDGRMLDRGNVLSAFSDDELSQELARRESCVSARHD